MIFIHGDNSVKRLNIDVNLAWFDFQVSKNTISISGSNMVSNDNESNEKVKSSKISNMAQNHLLNRVKTKIQLFSTSVYHYTYKIYFKYQNNIMKTIQKI